jgi:hypothetical protein
MFGGISKRWLNLSAIQSNLKGTLLIGTWAKGTDESEQEMVGRWTHDLNLPALYRSTSH